MNSYTGQRFKLIFALIAAVLFVFLCTASVSASSGLTLSRTSATVEIGNTLQLTAYQNGKVVSGAVWGSSDTSVAAVSGSGQVMAQRKAVPLLKLYVMVQKPNASSQLSKKQKAGQSVTMF